MPSLCSITRRYGLDWRDPSVWLIDPVIQIGSVSTTGAQSSFVPNFLSRLSPSPADHASTVSRSFLISADMGHAVHPNYTAKYEENHKPKINGGVVLKINANQR